MKIGKEYIFDSAHFIKGHPKCGNVHGHTWTLTVMIDGPVDLKTGFVIDFHVLNDIVRPIIAVLDHKIINDELKGVEIITAEILVQWFINKIRIAGDFIKGRIGVRLQEGQGGWCENWEGE